MSSVKMQGNEIGEVVVLSQAKLQATQHVSLQ